MSELAMQTRDDELRTLDREFSAEGSTMHVETYKARRAQIIEKHRRESSRGEPPPPSAPKPAAAGITKK